MSTDEFLRSIVKMKVSTGFLGGFLAGVVLALSVVLALVMPGVIAPICELMTGIGFASWIAHESVDGLPKVWINGDRLL